MSRRQLNKKRAEVPLKDVQVDPVAELGQEPAERDIDYLLHFRVINNYGNGDMWVEICGGLSSPKVKLRYWRAVFEGVHVEPLDGSVGVGWAVPIHGFEGVNGVGDDKQEAMLVDVGKAIELIQGVSTNRHFSRWSYVWLTFTDCLEDLWVPDRRVEIDDDGVALLIEGRLVDGKFRVFPGFAVIKDHELVGEMVERGSQVEKDLACDKAPVGGNWREMVDAVAVVSTLDIVVEAKAVQVGVKDFGDRIVQVSKVGFRSPELEFYAREIAWHPRKPIQSALVLIPRDSDHSAHTSIGRGS